jgi:hypothetical protein
MLEPQWFTIPVYTVNCEKMIKPSEICDAMKVYGTARYLYEIRHNNVTVKFGKSADRCVLHGERVYRQVGHLFSWGRSRLVGPNDITFLDIDSDYERMFGTFMDHKKITIIIWDLTDYKFQTTNMDAEIIKMEERLVSNYKTYYGQIPFGNKHDMTPLKKKALPLKASYDDLFGE